LDNNITSTSFPMSQPSQPITIPGKESPEERNDDAQQSPNSGGSSPSTSPGWSKAMFKSLFIYFIVGSKRKREDEDDAEQFKVSDKTGQLGLHHPVGLPYVPCRLDLILTMSIGC
jgi:hypothetical protein